MKVFKDVTVQITTHAKLGITYPEGIGCEDVLEQLKPFLVKADGAPAEILGVIKEPLKTKAEVPLELRNRRAENLKREVKNVVKKLRHEYRFLREPTVKEVAIKIGKAPENIRSLLYELAPKTGWKEQEKGQAKDEAKESINLAGWLKWLQEGDKSGKYSPAQIEELNRKAKEEIELATPSVIERAERIVKNYPGLAPKAKPSTTSRGRVFLYAPAGLDPWPEETNRVWRRIFREEAPGSGRPVLASASG